ncbi:MAG: sulfocyanin-like copper-binding protein [Gemmatimonadales bacterium]
MPQVVQRALLTVTLATVIACSGKSQNAASAPAPSAPPASHPATMDSAPAAADTSWIKSDSAERTVTLSLVVSKSAGSPSALINGYRSGQAQIEVPVRWTVKWNWRNEDSGAAHSLVVMTQREKVPLEGGRASFSNAMSRSVTEGLATGQSDQTTFEAEEAGWYWLMCGVPNHALNGEWLELRVSPDAHKGSVHLKQR